MTSVLKRPGSFCTDKWIALCKKNPIQSYITNLQTTLISFQIDGIKIPVSVHFKEYDNCYVGSNFVSILLWQEKLRRNHKKWLLPLTHLVGYFLKAVKINKQVIVNNYFFSTILYPKLSKQQLLNLKRQIVKKFPDHLIVFRGLNSYHCEEISNSLKELKFRLMKTRDIFIFDPTWKKTSRQKYHFRRDKRLLEKLGYEVVKENDLSLADYDRIIELYHQLYIQRHTEHSPKYTKEYLKDLINDKLITVIAIRKDGCIDGAFGIFEKDQQICTTFFGYDLNLPIKNEIYRLLTILLLEEVERRGLALNHGHGSSVAKRKRGLRPFLEVTAIYDRHLPYSRRLFWKISHFFMSCFGYRSMEHD